MSQRARHLLLGLAVGLAVAVLLTLLRGAYTMRALENKTLDARFRAFHDPARADTNIVIVDLDNYSLRLLGPELGRPPWPRDTWRRAVAFLSSGGARAIVFDFAFPEPDLLRPADDSGFAAASREAGTVVQAMTIQAIAGTDSAGIERPIPLLADAARGIGVINFTPDPIDGTLRRTPLRYRVGDRVYPALGVAAVMAADSAVAVPADTAAAIVNWRGPYRDVGSAHPETYRIVPLAAVIKGFDQLRSGETPALDPGTFRGKIVFVGASGSGLFEARANRSPATSR